MKVLDYDGLEYYNELIENKYLPKSGGTLTGNLTINKSTPVLYLKDNTVIRNTAPSADVNQNIIIHDKNAVNLAMFQSIYRTSKENIARIVAFNGTTTDSTWSSITVGYDSSGNVFTQAPTPATSDNSTKIATTAYVKSNLGSYLPLSGGTMTGALTINLNGNNPLTLKTTASYNDIQMTDGTNRIGILRFQKDTTNSVNKVTLGVMSYGTNNAPSGIEISRNNGGTVTATAPTPTTSDDSTKIATTAYVKSNLGSYLPLSGGTMTGNVTFNDGKLIKFQSTNTPAGSGGWIGGDSSGLRITSEAWGISDAGVRIEMNGKNYSTNPSQFSIITTDSSQSKTLVLKPDGTCSWDGKNIERVNTIGSNYIRYESGLQICWGSATASSSSYTTVTFGAAFTGTPRVVTQATPSGTIGHGLYMSKVASVGTSNFRLYCDDGSAWKAYAFDYIAVGKWK